VASRPLANTAASSAERAWWLRTLAVLQSPRPVFAALRDDSDEDAQARQEPLLAIVFLAGIAGVLATSVAGQLLDDPEYDGLLIAVWAVLAGGLHGLFGYLLIGALVYFGASVLGGLGTYRRARHLVGFAAAPLVLSLLAWPVRLAVYGQDVFRTGGSDDGAGIRVFQALDAALLVWALVLLLLGVRTVHGWSWPRSLAALMVALAPLALLALVLQV
jgi:hypothetical protein